MSNFSRTRTLRWLAGGALLLCTSLSHAQWVWLDEKGLKQFSDRPPPNSVPQKRILKQPAQTAAPLAAPVAPQALAPVAAPVAAPVVAQAAPAPAPGVHKRVVHHVAQARPASRNDDYAYRDTVYREPVRQQQQAPAPAQPNYVGIGTGAVIGGLIGNQVGGGRGKALATVAGVIGGGFLGNAVQNQVQQPQR